MIGAFSPGDIVNVRGREWVCLPTADNSNLCLRPLSGGESDIQVIRPELEKHPVKHASFQLPDISKVATQDAARLLSEALRISLRRGAGPFRSSAKLSFEPRAYQLVPLLMALRLSVVRLLIADDVGIGKTIEAGIILREFIDRGEISRFSILCPPHLVEQWTDELKVKFDLDVTAVTSSSAERLEKGLLASQSLFEAYPYTVVSLDYIKADRRRDNFARSCPKFVIVDEAHACVGNTGGKHLRYNLLKRLSEDDERHIVLLTATPHSGDEEAFIRLLTLLNSTFFGKSLDDESFRIQLSKHFLQRRRIDITGKDWGEDRAFPKHETTELTYSLDAAHKRFHESVLDYCLEVVEKAGQDQRVRRLAFWGTLALMRCVGSSPAAALSALRNRYNTNSEDLQDHIFDEDSEESDAVDIEPSNSLEDAHSLKELIKQAEQLLTQADPKIDATTKLVKKLVASGSNPVIFCRFIATAEYIAARLRTEFPKLNIDVVTGALTPEERRIRVESMEKSPRLLVATDCLSEGINLQGLFDSVLHYDLSWNPTRHQQREGRVDRFGQAKDVVRSALLFSPDSAIDGAVLDVILRKAETIRKATGVTVSLPEEKNAVTNALMNAVLLRRGKTEQLSFDLGLTVDAEKIESKWRDAEEGEKRSRARFAQNTIKPEEVAPEWKKWHEILGTKEYLENFVSRAMSRLNSKIETDNSGFAIAHLSFLPPAVRERLASRGLEGSIRLTYEGSHVPPRTEVISRNHPLPATLAEMIFESAMDENKNDDESIGRAGAWTSDNVKSITTIALLRLRFKLIVHGRKERLLLVEEANTVAFEGTQFDQVINGVEAQKLLESIASTNIADAARERLLKQAKEKIHESLNTSLKAYAVGRAEILAEDHARVRATGVNVPKVSVEPVLPADVVGIFVIIPAGV